MKTPYELPGSCEAVTGVLNAHNVGEFFWEGIEEQDIAEIEARQGFMQRMLNEFDEFTTATCERAVDALMAEWGENDTGTSDKLLGKWTIDDNGNYEPDDSSDEPTAFAAIYRADTNVLQVVWSNCLMWCNKCSPCYPGQGDLDTKGEDYLAYALHPDLMSERWDRLGDYNYVKGQD